MNERPLIGTETTYELFSTHSRKELTKVVKVSTRTKIILITVYLFMFWSDLPTFRPGMDSMTYGAVAKHILDTGDWATLHYADQAYKNFYQHPPLAIWMMAITTQAIEWIAGPAAARADWVLKLLPSIVAGIGAMIVYVWARRIRGEWFAFLATLILLTSTRYVKYSKGFMLDPFLATFSLGAVYTAVRAATSARARAGLFFASGVLVAAAFLSKGVFAFAPLVLGILILRKRSLPFLAGVAAPIVLWLAAGGGIHYVERYYAEHVADRLGGHSLGEHLAPIRNLFKVYWPWLPLFALGTWKIVRFYASSKERFEREMNRLDQSLLVPLAGALFFIGGFCLSGSFLEQYHVATYPFAAIVGAFAFPDSLEKFRPRIEKGLFALLAIAFVALLASPHSFRSTEHKNPIRIALKGARKAAQDANIEKSIQRITISTGVAEIWYALAMGTWNTDWDARSAPAMEPPQAGNSQLLLATSTELVAPGWIETDIEADGLRLYRSAYISNF